MTSEQLETLKELAAEKGYGRSPQHAKQVCKLALKIYDEFARLGLLSKASCK